MYNPHLHPMWARHTNAGKNGEPVRERGVTYGEASNLLTAARAKLGRYGGCAWYSVLDSRWKPYLETAKYGNRPITLGKLHEADWDILYGVLEKEFGGESGGLNPHQLFDRKAGIRRQAEAPKEGAERDAWQPLKAYDQVFVDCRIQGSHERLLLDTGATMNFMPLSFARDRGLVAIRGELATVKGCGGTYEVDCCAVYRLEVVISDALARERTVHDIFYAVEGSSTFILGMPFATAQDVMFHAKSRQFMWTKTDGQVANDQALTGCQAAPPAQVESEQIRGFISELKLLRDSTFWAWSKAPSEDDVLCRRFKVLCSRYQDRLETMVHEWRDIVSENKDLRERLNLVVPMAVLEGQRRSRESLLSREESLKRGKESSAALQARFKRDLAAQWKELEEMRMLMDQEQVELRKNQQDVKDEEYRQAASRTQLEARERLLESRDNAVVRLEEGVQRIKDSARSSSPKPPGHPHHKTVEVDLASKEVETRSFMSPTAASKARSTGTSTRLRS